MAIDFPSSPTLDQQFTSGGTSWIWDGSKWNLYAGANLVTQSELSSTLASYAPSDGPTISGTAIFVNKPTMPVYQDEIPYVPDSPGPPTLGDYYVNSTENVLYVYTGVTDGWVALGSTPDSDQVIIANRMFG